MFCGAYAGLTLHCRVDAAYMVTQWFKKYAEVRLFCTHSNPNRPKKNATGFQGKTRYRKLFLCV